jgi:hypothetical protein
VTIEIVKERQESGSTTWGAACADIDALMVVLGRLARQPILTIPLTPRRRGAPFATSSWPVVDQIGPTVAATS